MTTTAYRPLRFAFLLVLLCVPGVLSLLPMLAPSLANSLPAGSPPVAVILLLTVVQSLVILSICAVIGAYLAPKVGFSAPGLMGAGLWQTVRKNAPQALGAGMLLGAAAVLIDWAIFRPYLPEQLYMLSKAPAVAELIPSFLYGGIAEEVMMRWGLMSLITWVLYRLRGGKGEVHPAFVWAGILGAALLFGLGHLPAVRGAVGEVSTAVLIRTVVQNGIPGVLFGWLYARRGLETAMLAHIGAHIGMFLLRLLMA